MTDNLMSNSVSIMERLLGWNSIIYLLSGG